MECKAGLDTLVARETEVKIHILGDPLFELKGMKTIHTLKDAVQRIRSSHLATQTLR